MILDVDYCLEQAATAGFSQLKEEYDSGDWNTSGSLKSSLILSGTKVKAKKYIFTLINGRPPGDKIDYKGPIKEWVRKKIKPNESRVESVAFLTSRKIFEEGSAIYRGEAEALDISPAIAIAKTVFKTTLKQSIRELIKSI